MRLRDSKEHGQVHTAGRGQSWDLNKANVISLSYLVVYSALCHQLTLRFLESLLTLLVLRFLLCKGQE